MILHGDCLAILPTIPDNSIDAVLTDPPYGLAFMGKEWDGQVAFDPETWRHVLRVLKPGGHMAVFGGTRTHHRLWTAVEDAGFEIRDTLMWVFGSGFPKSLDVSKAIDKKLGAEREATGVMVYCGCRAGRGGHELVGAGSVESAKWKDVTAPATPQAAQWSGWGTALKPAYEPILLCRKPLMGTVAENVLEHGVGGLNIDGCRVGTASTGWNGKNTPGQRYGGGPWKEGEARPVEGRWPANLIHDGSDEVVSLFPISKSGDKVRHNNSNHGTVAKGVQYAHDTEGYADEGSAARFFYTAKASKKDRCGSKHPTVKPLSLLRYLITLITPRGGTVLDPFAGSGTTGAACQELGFDYVLIEREDEYVADCHRRLDQMMIGG